MARLTIPFFNSTKDATPNLDGSSPSLDPVPARDFTDDNSALCDYQFASAARRVTDIWLFLVESKVKFGESNDLNPSDIQSIRFSEKGRLATKEEWARVNWLYQVLSQYLTPELVRQRRVRASYRAIGALPIWAMVGCVTGFAISVAALIIDNRLYAYVTQIIGFLIWTIGLGALGSSAFLAVNTLGDRNDSKFDISEAGLVHIRMVLGSIFGFVLAVPISMPMYRKFIDGLMEKATIDSNVVVGVILPFLLGFSTSLVLTILDRFISAVDALFGVRPNTTGSGQTTPPPPPPAPAIGSASKRPPPIGGAPSGGGRNRSR